MITTGDYVLYKPPNTSSWRYGKIGEVAGILEDDEYCLVVFGINGSKVDTALCRHEHLTKVGPKTDPELFI